MRIRGLILTCFMCWQGSLLYSQQSLLNDSCSIQIKSGSLIEALQQISDSTGIRFGYRKKTIESKHVGSGQYNSKLSDILEELLVKNNLCYTVQAKQIIIHTACLPKYYTISGSIIEDGTFKSLPYISVSILNKSIGVIADADGFFEIDLPFNVNTPDTLIFSSLGYNKDSLVLEAGKSRQLCIMMVPKTYRVPEVLIRPIEYVQEKWGNRKDRSSGSLYLDTHGQQTALYIENKNNRIGTIESVEYYLSKKGNTDSPFRVRIYDADTNGLPGKDLIEDAIVVKPGNVSGWYSVDISMLSVALPNNGMFVSIEGVFPDEYEDYFGSSDFIDLTETNSKKTPQTLTYGQRIGYNKKGRDNTWHYSMSKIWFQLDKQAFGVMIAVVVKYEKVDKPEKIRK